MPAGLPGAVAGIRRLYAFHAGLLPSCKPVGGLPVRQQQPQDAQELRLQLWPLLNHKLLHNTCERESQERLFVPILTGLQLTTPFLTQKSADCKVLETSAS